MRTAVDTSVLLDVLGADPTHGVRSREALRAAFTAGGLVACEVVWAELRAHFSDAQSFADTTTLLGLRFDPISPDAAALAGELWHEYRRRGRGPRTRVVADMLIGAHARSQADVLLTRDRGFFRRYFSDLRIVDPSGS
jgi:predicted nucleic acid-binding protein